MVLPIVVAAVVAGSLVTSGIVVHERNPVVGNVLIGAGVGTIIGGGLGTAAGAGFSVATGATTGGVIGGIGGVVVGPHVSYAKTRYVVSHYPDPAKNISGY